MRNQDPFQNGKLPFKPLSEGLGLDHFADGLPYAPSQIKRRPMVQFNFPPIKQPSHPPAQTVKSTAQRPIPQQQKKNELSPTVVNATFTHRILAYFTDIVFTMGIYVGILWAGLSLNGYRFSQINNYHYFFPLFLLYLVIHVSYFLIQETSWACTLGKMFVGIQIQSESGLATLVRALCFFMAAFPLGIGLLWYFFDSKHRCWHDVITDTEVIKA